MIKILDWTLWKLGWHSKYRRLKCRFGLHKYRYATVYIGMAWVHAGKECEYCKCGSVDIHKARILIGKAYQKGIDKVEIDYVAHCNGLEKLIRVWGKKYVQSELDKLP